MECSHCPVCCMKKSHKIPQNKILNAIFKLWNNENVIELNMSDISTTLTIIVLILLLYVIIKLFVQMFKAITDSINDIKPKQERFKTGGHKKKKR